MIYSSLAVLALSASAVINPLTNLVHLHPRPAQPDHRVNVVLYNKGASFVDVKIEGQVYTVKAHAGISVKAPAGTMVYADSRSSTHRRGEAILELTPGLEDQRVNID